MPSHDSSGLKQRRNDCSVPLLFFCLGGEFSLTSGCLRISRLGDRVSGVKITNSRSPNNCRAPVLSGGGIAAQSAQTVGCEGPDSNLWRSKEWHACKIAMRDWGRTQRDFLNINMYSRGGGISWPIAKTQRESGLLGRVQQKRLLPHHVCLYHTRLDLQFDGQLLSPLRE